MRVAVFGSKDWTDYPDLMRQLTIFIQDAVSLEHKEITLVHTGKQGAEDMVTEYIGKTEKFLRQKGFRLKEELFRGDKNLADLKIIESGIGYAILFSTKDKRTISCSKLLQAYEIPHKVVE
jgi:hypothetical protein